MIDIVPVQRSLRCRRSAACFLPDSLPSAHALGYVDAAAPRLDTWGLYRTQDETMPRYKYAIPPLSARYSIRANRAASCIIATKASPHGNFAALFWRYAYAS